MNEREYLVFCVDDDADFLNSLELFLPEQIRAGAPPGVRYRPLFFADPHEALEAAEGMKEAGERVALVLSDQKMPRMKGTEFLTAMRRVYPDSVRVLLTGYAGLESAIVAINAQLLDKYLTKPIENEHDFAVTLRHLLQRFHMQQTIVDQTRRLGELYAFANRLNAMQSFEETARDTASFTAEALRCRSATVLRAEGGRLVVAGWHGGPERGTLGAGPVFTAVPAAPGAGAARAASLAELPYAALLPEGFARDGGEGGAAWVPLACGGRFLGMLEAAGRIGDPEFTEEDLTTLGYVGHTAAIALGNQLDRRELERSMEETREANARLEALDRLKTDFLAFISHELRTPLTALSAVDLLGGLSDEEARAELVQSMQAGYGRLRDFVTRGLEYFSWAAGRREIAARRVALDQLARQVIAAHPRLADAALTTEFPEVPCEVDCDPDSLGEVIRILLDNGLKFSEGEKALRVEIAVEGERLRLRVADSGRGFAPDMAREIFRPFTITNVQNHSQGTGLNLALAAAIVRAHGGSIRAESGGAGCGAAFLVELPRPERPVAPAPDPEPALTA